jgi:hypothetical protein
MNFRPNFNKYFFEQWSYDSGAGVGLKLIGFPTDINKFIELLHGESCNPVATRRILKELEEKGIKYTTLMSHLNFNYIGDQLKEIGVKMEIVPPISADKLQNLELDNLAFDLFKNNQKIDFIQLGEDDKKEIKNRLDIFKKSVEKHYCNFGPYDDNPLVYRPALENARQKKQRYE